MKSLEEHRSIQTIAEEAGSFDESRRRFTKSGLVVSSVLLTLASRPSFGGTGWGGGKTKVGLGGGKVCRSPSGMLSGNLSHHGKHSGGGGKTCDYWTSNCYSWPTHCYDNFSSHFDCTHASNCSHDSQNYPYTVLDILCRKHVGYVQTYTKNNNYGSYSYNYFGTRYCNQNGYDASAYNNLDCPDFSPYKSIDSNCDVDTLGQYCVAALLNCRAGYTPYLTEETVKAIFSECKSKGYFQPTAGVHWTPSQCVSYLQSTQDCTYWA
jgi:hypothetical protein